MAVDDRSEPPNTVVRLLDEGYNWLLRPACVVVTRSQGQVEVPELAPRRRPTAQNNEIAAPVITISKHD
jgi:hypothetical protein